MILFGAMYYIVPRVARLGLPRAAFIKVHFWVRARACALRHRHLHRRVVAGPRAKYVRAAFHRFHRAREAFPAVRTGSGILMGSDTSFRPLYLQCCCAGIAALGRQPARMVHSLVAVLPGRAGPRCSWVGRRWSGWPGFQIARCRPQPGLRNYSSNKRTAAKSTSAKARLLPLATDASHGLRLRSTRRWGRASVRAITSSTGRTARNQRTGARLLTSAYASPAATGICASLQPAQRHARNR
jgi:hypothetical protein